MMIFLTTPELGNIRSHQRDTHVEEGAFAEEKILDTPELGSDDDRFTDWNEHFLLLKQKLHFSTSNYNYGLSFQSKNMEDPGLGAHTDCKNTDKASRIILAETMWNIQNQMQKTY